jgi:branched-chain amino acid transport system substrate-binding protein
MRSLYLCIAALPALLFFGSPAYGEPGVTGGEIIFGQVAAFSGPTASLGKEMGEGITAAFEEANRSGGVHGRKLTLISEDDSYEPAKSIEAAKKLVNGGKIFGLIGSVGTPTSAAIEPIAQAAGVPFIAPFTGAQFLREPFNPNVVNVRASYFEETETMVDHLTKDAGATRIAILYQDDAFGRAGLEGVQRALAKRGMILAAEGTFERNTAAVKSALLKIQRAQPEAVILIGPYKPCAEFIKLARSLKLDALFLCLSFAGGNPLAQEAGPAGAGVIVTQVVPFPEDEALPVVARYKAALRAVDPLGKPGFVSLEGYIAGRLAIAALEKEQGEPTRDNFLNTIFSSSFDLGGVKLNFGPENNQGTAQVFLTILRQDGTFKLTDSLGFKSQSAILPKHRG